LIEFFYIIVTEVMIMKKESFVVQTEHGSLCANVVWGKMETLDGKEHAVLVIKTDTSAAVTILTKGLFYLKKEGEKKLNLFRIEHSRRARISGCMFVKAITISDSIRSSENEVLREMREILKLRSVSPYSEKSPQVPSYSIAS